MSCKIYKSNLEIFQPLWRQHAEKKQIYFFELPKRKNFSCKINRVFLKVTSVNCLHGVSSEQKYLM